MDVWQIISRDVFASLVKDVSETASLAEQESKQGGEGDGIITTGNQDSEEDDQRQTILDVLPMEMIRHTLRFLPNSDLCALRLVCQNMMMAASDPQVLRLKLSKHLGENDFDSKELEPLLSNVTSMIVSEINKATDPSDKNTENTFEDDQIPGKIFQKLDAQCLILHELRVMQTTIPSSVSMSAHANLAERLITLDLQSVTLKSIAHFLPATYPKLKSLHLQNCTFEGKTPFDGLPEIRMPNLETLHVEMVEDFGDKEFRQLMQGTCGNLSKLSKLYLAQVKMKGEDFGTLDLANLIKLKVVNCEFNDEWLSQLMHLRRLESLKMSSISIKDNCSPYTFKHMTELRTLKVEYCDLGNRIVSAMARYLPNLKRWTLTPNEDGTITDEAFSGLIPHDHLEEINFDRLQLTDNVLRQIILLAPNLKELSLSVCTAGDEAIALVSKLQHLIKLSLHGTQMTDVGLAALEPKLDVLSELTIQSRLITLAGFQRSLARPTKVDTLYKLCLTFDDPERELSYYREQEDEIRAELAIKRLPTELLLVSLKRFHDVKNLNLDNVSLTVVEADQMCSQNPNLETLTMMTCEMTEEAAVSIGTHLTSLKCLSVCETHLPENVVMKLLQSITSRDSLERVYINNEPFLSIENLRAVIPLAAHCTVFEVRNFQYEKGVSLTNMTEYKEVSISGSEMDDDVILDIVQLMPEVIILILSEVMVTTRGIVEIARLVPRVISLSVKATTIGDDVMPVIGQDFPSLTYLSLECEHLTDDGLDKLGKQLDTIETLTLRRTAITDEGARRIAPKLIALKYLHIYDNPKITRELHAYMLATYPDVQHADFPEPEMGGQQQEGNDQGVQDGGDVMVELQAAVNPVVEQPGPAVPEGNADLAPPLADIAGGPELPLAELVEDQRIS